MKFIVKQNKERGWYYVTRDDEDESIFGDRLSTEKREAEQCARAANIAYSMAVSDLKKKFYSGAMDIFRY